MGTDGKNPLLAKVDVERKRAFHVHAFISWWVGLPALGSGFEPAVHALKTGTSTRPYVTDVAVFINRDC